MALPVKKRYTAKEYLELERQAEYKSEFADGEIFALAGANENHCLISVNCTVYLGQQLRGSSNHIFASQMRLEVAQCYVYPDVSVVCGESEFADKRRDVLINPTLIIEILSPATESYDRGEKFGRYRTLRSLQTYVLISQDRPLLEIFERQKTGGWLLSEYEGLDKSAPLPTIGCGLQLGEVYHEVDFETSPETYRGQ